MVNEEFLRRVIKRIERDVEQWDQLAWAQIDVPTALDKELASDDERHEEYSRLRYQEVRQFQIDWEQVMGYVIVPEDACGTLFCFAGHAVQEAGYKIVMRKGEDISSYCLDPETGDVQYIMSTAKDLLGLNEHQRADLFAASERSLGEFKELVTEVTGVELD